MSTTSLPHPVLDHVALASRHAWSNLIRYGYELGGRWLGAPPMAELENFYFCQVELAGDGLSFRVEAYPLGGEGAGGEGGGRLRGLTSSRPASVVRAAWLSSPNCTPLRPDRFTQIAIADRASADGANRGWW